MSHVWKKKTKIKTKNQTILYLIFENLITLLKKTKDNFPNTENEWCKIWSDRERE